MEDILISVFRELNRAIATYVAMDFMLDSLRRFLRGRR